MKNRIGAVFACVMLIFLSACGSDPRGRWESFCGSLSGHCIAFTAEVRCEYADKTVSFTLDYEEDADGCTVTVIEPRSIAGIKAHLKDTGSSLEFDGAMLDTGELDRYGLSPLSSLPELCSAMRTAYAQSFWTEAGQNVVQLVPTDALTVTVWLDESFTTPVYAELSSDGLTVVYCDIRNWKIT